MKVTETKLVNLIKECFEEVVKEELAGTYGVSDHMDNSDVKLDEVEGYGVSDYMDKGQGDMQERNANEIGMSDDEVVKSRIDREKNDMIKRHGDTSDVRGYVNSIPDADWDWHRLFRHDITNNSHGIGIVDRYAKRYGEEAVADLREDGIQNNVPEYTHYAVNKNTGKIVNGWDYSGHEQSELNSYKRDYFWQDLADNELDPKQYTILTKASLIRRGINPDDNNCWANS